MASKIEPRKILSETVSFVFGNRNRLLRALCIPFLLYTAIGFVNSINHPMRGTVLLSILGLVIETWFAVTTHRLVLLGPDSVPTWGLRKITRREALFLLHALVFIIALTVIFYIMKRTPTVVLSITSQLFKPEHFLENYYAYMIPIAIINVFWICVVLFAINRLTLVFPGIAIDQGVSFPLSWKLTKNHQIRLFITLIVFPLILGTLGILIRTIPGSTVMVSLLNTLMYVFVVAALSISYREICKIEYGS